MVTGTVGSKVEISFIGQPKPAGKGPQPQPSDTSEISVWGETLQIEEETEMQTSMYYLQERFQVMEGTGWTLET